MDDVGVPHFADIKPVNGHFRKVYRTRLVYHPNMLLAGISSLPSLDKTTRIEGPNGMYSAVAKYAEMHIRLPGIEPPRTEMRRRLPVYIGGHVLPVPDTRYTLNRAVAFDTRVAGEVPEIDMEILAKFERFVDRKVKEWAVVNETEDTSVETWLDKSRNYTEARKNELRKVIDEQDLSHSLMPADRQVNFFVKDEDYPTFKKPRGILAVQDKVKVALGPFAKVMEEEVYSNNTTFKIKFTKHVPVDKQHIFMKQLMWILGGSYKCTDYSSFECSFNSALQSVCEQVVYGHLLKAFPVAVRNYRLMEGWNYIRSKDGTLIAKIFCRRCSGEMVTSLGNGVTNILLVEFMEDLAKEMGLEVIVEIANPDGVVETRVLEKDPPIVPGDTAGQIVGGVAEGDDLEMQSTRPMNVTLAGKLGFKITEVTPRSQGEAGYCGKFFTDTEMVMVVDPYESIMKMGWTRSQQKHGGPKLMRQLLKAKCLSMLYQTPGCPILAVLARRIVELIPERAVFDWDWYERQVFSTQVVESLEVRLSNEVTEQYEKLVQGKTPHTRALFELLYAVPLSLQLQCEAYARGLDGLRELDGPFSVLFALCPRKEVAVWRDCWDSYVVTHRAGDTWWR